MNADTRDKTAADEVNPADYSFAVNLMQFLVVPTFVLDPQGQVMIWNKACERLTGLPARDVLGTRNHWRAFYDEPRPCLADLLVQNRMAAIDELYAAHQAVSDQAHGVHAENWCVMPRLGTQLYLAIDAGPIYDGDGGLIAVVETLRDMTTQKRAQQELEQLATQDGLTGVANRRGLDDRLTREWRRAVRDRQPLSVIMIYVDHFKAYNDHYGHQRGDDCLRRVAGALTQSVFRPPDIVARYGGEEFSVVLPSTDLNAALLVAERLRHDIAALTIPHAASPVGTVTVSMGVASLVPDLEHGKEELVSRADQALYQAKRAGRDRVQGFRPDSGAGAQTP